MSHLPEVLPVHKIPPYVETVTAHKRFGKMHRGKALAFLLMKAELHPELLK